jgi:hypothetical protein
VLRLQLAILNVQNGFIFLGNSSFRLLMRRFEPISIAAAALTIVHPTIAHLGGASASTVAGLVALFLSTPLLLRIAILPFIAIFCFYAIIAFDSANVKPLIFVFSAYSFCFAILYRKKYANTFCIILLSIITLIMLIQAWTKIEIFTFFNSYNKYPEGNHLIYYHRPVSIFPAQVYASQILICIWVLPFLYRNGGRIFWIAFGIASGVSGATAGILGVILATPAAASLRHFWHLFSFCGWITAIYLLDQTRFWANYSFKETANSVRTRIDTRIIELNNPAEGALLAESHTSFLHSYGMANFRVVIALLAIRFLVFIIQCRGLRLHDLIVATSYCACFVAIIITQVLHFTAGSFFFTPILGLLIAAEFHFAKWIKTRVAN